MIGGRRDQTHVHVDPRARVGQDDPLLDLKALQRAARRLAARQKDAVPRRVGTFEGVQVEDHLARRNQLDEGQRLAVEACREKRAPGLTRVDRGDRGAGRRNRHAEIGVFDDRRRRDDHGDRLLLGERQAVDPESLLLAGQREKLRPRRFRRRVEVEHDLAPVGGRGVGRGGRQRKGLVSGAAVSHAVLVELKMEFGFDGHRSSVSDPSRQPVAHLGLQIPVDVGGGGRSGHPQGSRADAEDLAIDGDRLIAGPGAPAGSVGEGIAVDDGASRLGTGDAGSQQGQQDGAKKRFCHGVFLKVASAACAISVSSGPCTESTR